MLVPHHAVYVTREETVRHCVLMGTLILLLISVPVHAHVRDVQPHLVTVSIHSSHHNFCIDCCRMPTLRSRSPSSNVQMFSLPTA
jgi:hypothetical protein